MQFPGSQRALSTQLKAQGRVSLAANSARSLVCTRPTQQQVQQPSKARQALETMNQVGFPSFGSC